MIARPLLLLSSVAFVTMPAAAQSSHHVLKGDSVAIYNLVGELRVEAGSGSDVAVDVQRGGADAAKLDIQTGPLRGRETLRIIYPDDVISMPQWGRGWNTTLRVRDDGTFGEEHGKHERSGWFREGHEVRITGRGRNGEGLEAFADLRVSVPTGKNVALYLGVGKAFVSNVDGVIRVYVASADVAADRTRGSLKVETGSGNVDLRTASGDIDLETGSGDITVAGAQGSSLTGSSGDDLSFETGSGDVDVALVATFRSVHIETGSGDVTLKVPPTLGAEVDLDTGSGDIDLGGLTLQVRRIEHDHVTGTMGDGKGRLSVETGSGNVRLEKL